MTSTIVSDAISSAESELEVKEEKVDGRNVTGKIFDGRDWMLLLLLDDKEMILILLISRNRSRNDYYRPSRYSPPPMKRMRPDFEERGHPGRFGMHEFGGYGGFNHDPYGALSPYGVGPAPGPREHHPPPVSDGMTQPPMLTLKQFLATQDDSIPDDVAILKYNEYKLEFKRGQMNEFFVSHKDEEW